MLLFEGGRQQWTSHSMGLRCRAAIRPAFPSQVPQLLHAQMQVPNGTQSFSQTDCSHKAFFSSGHQHHAQQTFQEWTFGFFGPSLHSFAFCRIPAIHDHHTLFRAHCVDLSLLHFSHLLSPSAEFVCFSGASPPGFLVSAAHPPSGLFACPLQISIGTRSSYCTTSISPPIYSTLKSRSLSCNSSASCTSESSLCFLASWLPFH